MADSDGDVGGTIWLPLAVLVVFAVVIVAPLRRAPTSLQKLDSSPKEEKDSCSWLTDDDCDWCVDTDVEDVELDEAGP